MMNEPLSFVPQALPSVPCNDRHCLPVCSAISCALTPDGTMLSMGKAVNLRERWRQHHRALRLQDMDCATLAWHLCPSEERIA
jgi:hypothetical protein